MSFYFARLFFKSLISKDLDFIETRFLKVQSVCNGQVEVELVSSDISDVYIEPNDSIAYDPVYIDFEDFEKVINKDSEVFLLSDSITEIYIQRLTEYNSHFNYAYGKSNSSGYFQKPF